MRVKLNECVGCGLPCTGKACPKYTQEAVLCDHCRKSYADYIIDRNDLCADCAENYLNDLWSELSIAEKSDVLDMNCTRI